MKITSCIDLSSSCLVPSGRRTVQSTRHGVDPRRR
jgi:hypothetical protein